MSEYTDFKLGDRTLSSFGGVIVNEDSCEKTYLSGMSSRKEKINGHDGEYVYDKSTRDPVAIDEMIAIVDEKLFNENEFKTWLDCKEERWFNYVGDYKKIKVLREDTVKGKLYSNGQKIPISFVGNAGLWDSLIENKFIQNTPSVNVEYKFNNNGCEPSKPLIRLTCVGSKVDTEFQVNDKVYRIKNMTDQIYIDCDKECVYIDVNGTKISRLGEFECYSKDTFKYTFPKLKVGENFFKLLKGSLSKVEILINEKWI